MQVAQIERVQAAVVLGRPGVDVDARTQAQVATFGNDELAGQRRRQPPEGRA